MEGRKRRKRKNDRLDANKLARLGRVDPQSLFPIEHRSTQVRQDLVVLRARDTLVQVRDATDQCHAGIGEEYGREAARKRQNSSKRPTSWGICAR
jgi:hypothetical protein